MGRTWAVCTAGVVLSTVCHKTLFFLKKKRLPEHSKSAEVTIDATFKKLKPEDVVLLRFLFDIDKEINVGSGSVGFNQITTTMLIYYHGRKNPQTLLIM